MLTAAAPPLVDPYLNLPVAAPVLDAYSYTVAGESPRRASRFILTRLNASLRPASAQAESRLRQAQIEAEVGMIKSRPDWADGLLCSLTRPHGTTKARLLDNHERWSAWFETRTRRAVSQYRVIDYTLMDNPHIHALLYGASASLIDEAKDAWNGINRTPRRARSYAPDIQPIEGDGALFYCARKAVWYGERDLLGPWPTMPPSIEPVIRESPEEVINRELRDLVNVRRLGRPRREILYAQSWLVVQLRQGRRNVSDLREQLDGLEFSWETILNAKRTLGVIATKVGKKTWMWSLPQDRT